MVFTKPNAFQFELEKQKISKVIVFSDRAEIHRSIQFNCEEIGEILLILTKLPQIHVKNSVRVESRSQAKIVEVSFPERLSSNGTSDEELGSIKKEIKRLENDKIHLINEQGTKKSMKKVLENYADSLSSKEVNLLQEENIETLFNFLNNFEKSTRELDSSILEIEQKLIFINETINQLNLKVNKNQTHVNQDFTQDVCIKFTLESNSEVTFDVSYVVSNASWIPMYEIRAYGDEKKLKIMYFGEIKQTTGENWNQVNLFLSTATPFISGEIPTISTVKIGSINPRYFEGYYGDGIMELALAEAGQVESTGEVIHMQSRRDEGKFLGGRNAKVRLQPPAPSMAPGGGGGSPDISSPKAHIKEQSITTTFEIPHLSDIPNDDSMHRVTIGIIDIIPAFEYLCHPSLSLYAFLKAKSINKSDYPLLEGEAKIYLDGNFVSNSRIPSVSPNEEFTCFLGADSGIKIEYKQPQTYTSFSGLLYKYATDTITKEILIKNNKKEEIKITIKECLPLSTENKINVKMIHPDLTNDIKLNEENIIEWNLKIEPSSNSSLSLIYEIIRLDGVDYYIQNQNY